MNHNYKPGDKVELNCSVEEFCSRVFAGMDIFNNNFKCGFAIVCDCDDGDDGDVFIRSGDDSEKGQSVIDFDELDCIKPYEEKQEMQNNYTQEMADLGIKPQAGMMCQFGCDEGGNPLELLFVGKEHSISLDKDGLEWCMPTNEIIPIKPEKSPLEIAKEKQVKEVKEIIESFWSAKQASKALQDAGLLAEIKL